MNDPLDINLERLRRAVARRVGSVEHLPPASHAAYTAAPPQVVDAQRSVLPRWLTTLFQPRGS